MKQFQFDRDQGIPFVDARIYSAMRSRRISLVFDTGSAITQVDTDFVERLGYSARDAERVSGVKAAVGDVQQGYVLRLEKLTVFRIDFVGIPVLVYDFDNFKDDGVDGLLGFDVIKQLLLEMNGPTGELKVFYESGSISILTAFGGNPDSK